MLCECECPGGLNKNRDTTYATGTQTGSLFPAMAMLETPMLYDSLDHAHRAMNGDRPRFPTREISVCPNLSAGYSFGFGALAFDAAGFTMHVAGFFLVF